MSSVPTVYRRISLTPTVSTTYTIADYIASDAVMYSVDDYDVVSESPYATLVAKSLTTFRIAVTINSPAYPNQCWLEFRRTGI